MLRSSFGVGTVALGTLTGTITLRRNKSSCSKSFSQRPMVISGPSGVGKGTLISKLMDEFGDDYVGFSVSHTTRKPRPGEVDGIHYHFRSLSDVNAMIERDEFVEYARVHGNVYGTSKKSVETVASQGRVCIMDIDVQGAQQVSKSDLAPFFVFILPPSLEELERRLRGRGTETEEKVLLRLNTAKHEIDISNEAFWDTSLVNDDIEATYQQLRFKFLQHCLIGPLE